MKQYYHEGKNLIINEGENITFSAPGFLFCGVPTEEQLFDWGFSIHTEPEPAPEDKEKESITNRMMEIEQTLASMDYLTSKYIDGEDMSQYGDWQQERKELRAEYRELEKLI